mgnify:CR=1 FL=1
MKIWEVDARSFAHDIKELRLDAQLTQKDLANRLHKVSVSGIKNWEQEVSLPNLATLIEIAKVFKIDEIRIDTKRGWYR